MPRLVLAPPTMTPVSRPPVSRPEELRDLKLRIQRGVYVVDPRLVAESVLRRNGLRLMWSGWGPQPRRCS